MIKLNLMLKKDFKLSFPVWSHWYWVYLFNLKMKDMIFIHICHRHFYPTNIILYNLKKKEKLCNIINHGRIESIHGFKDKILFEENIKKAKDINSKGYEALFRNLKSINCFYRGDIDKANRLYAIRSLE